MTESSSFKDRETALLRELSALYTKLNQVRDKRFKEERMSSVGGASDISDSEGTTGSRRRRRVLLVTRTLPFWLVSEDAQSQWRAEFREHASLNGVMEIYQSLHESYDCVWIGSVHGEIEPSEQNTLKEQLLQDRKYYPVVLDKKREKLYYEGFCKTVLWPLFHSCPPTTDDQIRQHGMMEDGQEHDCSMEKMWQAYVAANQAFADAVQEVYEEGDLIWIQGYHLMLVPQMVHNLFPNIKVCVGFFMHIPFPSAELYRILNNREDILTGILGADLIGFQTYDYARHFQSACVRLLGLESSHKGVDFNGHFARVTSCPVGIDANKYIAMVQLDAVQEQMKQLRNQVSEKRVILGVDQLDQTKGLVLKLLAVEDLFAQKPELAKKVVFVQIVTGASEFQSALESQVESLVSRINSKLQDVGTDGPVQYLNKDISTEALIALYALADALVITPVRDGMNTIPFGYVVCREAMNKHARVILSEFAGCAKSLGKARVVNPWHTEELTNALFESLHDNEDVMRAHQHMFSYVSSFTSRHWADNFLEQLHECSEENAASGSGRELSRRDMTSAYSRSTRRLIFINYEGVLAVDASIPELAYPPQELIWQLSMLTKDPRNTVVIVSARSISVCEQWFAGLSGNLVLAAEYGVYLKWIGDNECWHCMVPDMDVSWWEDVVPLLEYYTERTPGAYIERKTSSVAWHYRDCDLDHGLWQASELMVSLREITRYLPVSVYPGNRYLEVRPQKVSKADLFERIWQYMNWFSLFPTKDPLTTDYFGEVVRSPTFPTMKPHGARNDVIHNDDPITVGSDDLHSRTTDSLDRDRNIVMDSGASTLAQLHVDGVNEKQPVDFVLVIASGDDRTDEDLFAFLVPPPIDLDAYSRQVENDDMFDSQKHEQESLEIDIADFSCSSQHHRHSSQKAGSPDGGIGSSSFDDVSDDMSYNTFRRLLERDEHADTLGRHHSDAKSENSKTPAKLSASDRATKMFPMSMLDRSFSAKHDEMSDKSKLSRRDFPPTAVLFKAMKERYGESVGLQRLPDSLAACWALVCPPPAPLKLEMGSTSLSSTSLTLSQENSGKMMAKENTKTSAVIEGGSENSDGSASEKPTQHEMKVKLDSNVADKEPNVMAETLVSHTPSAADEVDDGRYRFPVNTFVCTLGRKPSQAPYYIKNSGDLFQLLQEMGMSSHIRKQRLLSVGSVADTQSKA
ncbi:hypothetical protein PsorP6_008827 [Peronosclerospora sorghi]|uniref:Uncharacterized protein n=1 Tax=Peronosclerospora sorghi TaxID=230839 RepID=A0ACC0VYD8_9STRA|nr:hypothetical protein PsorP6_008827 [Peronosclerospora sorghi]